MAKTKTTPPAEPAATPTAPRYDWPQSIEPRPLFVTLAPREMEVAAQELAATIPKILTLEHNAKQSANQWKATIDGVRCNQSRLSTIVQERREERPVDCEWIFECCGVDSVTGERMYHPEKKTLFRTDTWEALETRDITSDERQMSLLPDEGPVEETTPMDIDAAPEVEPTA